jgi:hypothetical protein
VAPLQDGLVARIAETLGKAHINILALDAMDVKDFDMVVLTVDRYDDALHELRDAGIDAVTEDAVVIRIKDEPGSLAKVTRRLHESGVYVSSIRILQRQAGVGVVAVAMARPQEGIALIEDLLIER